MAIIDDKKALRKAIKEKKSKVSFEKKHIRSISILNELEKHPSFVNSKNILAYWSMQDEVNTHAFVEKWNKEKNVYLPVVVGNELEFKLFTGINNMKTEPIYGILEPQSDPLIDYSIIDLAIIPGVAFDYKNNRMGRGKAFYDKILAKINTIKIGICFDFQLINKIPTESTDIPMDYVISEQ